MSFASLRARVMAREARSLSQVVALDGGLADFVPPSSAMTGSADSVPPSHATIGLADSVPPSHATTGLADSVPPSRATNVAADSVPPSHAMTGLADSVPPPHATIGLADSVPIVAVADSASARPRSSRSGNDRECCLMCDRYAMYRAADVGARREFCREHAPSTYVHAHNFALGRPEPALRKRQCRKW